MNRPMPTSMRTPLELRHLRNFWILAEELNFTRAARRAIISQSAMSEQIARLEEVLDTRLFDRDRRSVRLTNAGQVLLRSMPGLFDHVDGILAATREAGGATRTTLRIGYSAMSLNTPMAAILHQFRQRHPEIETVLKQQSSSGSEKALLHDSFDCIFTPHPPDNPLLSHVIVAQEPLLCCMPTDSPLAANATVQMADLQGVPLILPDQGSRFATFILAALSAAGVEPQVIARCSRPSVFLTMISAGMGVAILPASLRGMAPDSLKLRPFGAPQLCIPFALVWNRARYTHAIDRLVALAQPA